jgi:5-formyltetrahydrofolate cyclo-ligase
MRGARAAQPPHSQRAAARRVCSRLARTPWFRRSRTLSAYWPVGGELDLRPLIDLALRLGKRVYLPIVDFPARRLHFARFRDGDSLRVSGYGLSEPHGSAPQRIDPWRLDLVLLPLVGFDSHGTRLGMGGGYYDRTFGGIDTRTSWRRPRLVGVAYELQHVGRLERATWDVPIDAVVTDRATYRFPQE